MWGLGPGARGPVVVVLRVQEELSGKDWLHLQGEGEAMSRLSPFPTFYAPVGSDSLMMAPSPHTFYMQGHTDQRVI